MPTFKENDFITFKLKSKKTDPSKNSNKKHSITYCPQKTHQYFNSIISSIPKHQGSIAIFGINAYSKKLLKSISSSHNLHKQFVSTSLTNSPSQNLLNSMTHLLQTKKYKQIQIYYANASKEALLTN
ncbi:MAG: hypothetical protein KKA81_15185 [Bacteroidetes bacterium]|nr:hypothetical protein [Bacteroidota bacterium]